MASWDLAAGICQLLALPGCPAEERPTPHLQLSSLSNGSSQKLGTGEKQKICINCLKLHTDGYSLLILLNVIRV